MIEEFDKLDAEEKRVMFRTPGYISILIAGADNKIDRAELNEAVSLSKIKTSRARKNLQSYYQELSKTFSEDLRALVEILPSKAEDRNPILIAELRKLNHILPKLDKEFARQFYLSMKDFAKKIAEASGGVLGYMAIGYEESKLIDLDMIKEPK